MKKTLTIIVAIAITGLSAMAGTNSTSGILTAAITIEVTTATVNNIGEVSWKTTGKLNVRRYELEKSTDGQHFDYITAVAGKNQQLQSNFVVQDRNLMEGINYYRLKIIDSKGKINYSKIVSLDNKIAAPELKILPGTYSDELYICLPANTQVNTALITDAMGRTVITDPGINNFTNFASVELGSLPTGIYKINVLTNSGLTANLKFSKK